MNKFNLKSKMNSGELVSQLNKSEIDSAASNVRSWITNEIATDIPAVKLLGVTPDDIR